MHKLVGYCERWSAKPGARLGFMVSSDGGAAFDLRFVRLLCADPNPRGPGYTETAMPTSLDGPVRGQDQPAYAGSYAHASGAALDGQEGLAVSLTCWPTTPALREQVLFCVSGDGWQFLLGLDGSGAPFADCRQGDGPAVRVGLKRPLLARHWYDLAAGHDADGRLWLSQRARGTLAVPATQADADGMADVPGYRGAFSVSMAAGRRRGPDGPMTGHYNGKLERPALWHGPRDAAGLLQRQRQPVPGGAGLVALWDFSRGIPGSTAADIGPNALHAALVNLPGRAMTGASWTGAVHDWRQAPDQYAAIHFHDDDVGDLGWDESFALEIPADWPSGFYAAYIRNGAGEDMIPFFVRPAQPAADVLLLLPTYTYQVYGNHVRPGRGAEIAGRAAAWGALTETPDMNPQFGLSTYNDHSDGSGVAITTHRRPMLDTRPRQFVMMDPGADASGTSRICSDSYIVHWLHTMGMACDVATDHDLHEDGAALLAPYRVVIAAQHPEYLSDRMMAALEEYLSAGGRMMYLGGNGFYWRAEPSATEPHALEIRRAENGIRVWATEPGEDHHAFGDGGLAGLWRRVGRPSHRLVGNGFSAQGQQLGFPYRFTDAILDPRVAFMRDGLAVQPGEAFGERGYMGGGAAGFELDSVDPRHGTPPNTLVVAKGIVIHPDYHPVNEDRLAVQLPKRTEDWSCADMLFFETASGGAVFSVGSMTFVGSLAVDGYDNVLCRLATNVLRRFADPAAF